MNRQLKRIEQTLQQMEKAGVAAAVDGVATGIATDVVATTVAVVAATRAVEPPLAAPSKAVSAIGGRCGNRGTPNDGWFGDGFHGLCGADSTG
jgi:DNA-binding IscR family transcriptional regulator